MPVYAQIVVEDDIKTTDTVNIFETGETASEKTKSPKLAMFANILVPGLGHQYLGDKRRAFIYFSTEAALIFGMVFCERYSKKVFGDSRSYASNYAGIQCTKDPDDEYWSIIGNKLFLDTKEYNTVMELNREFDKKYVNQSDLWYWENEYYQERYRKLREDAMNFHVVSSFFLGAMLLNHVVSFIDVRIMSKRRSTHYQSSVNIQPYYSISDKKLGVSFTQNF
jgi:hypothetical protein